MVLGLGYGPITPASSQVLARTAPPARMALTFSLKQTGVPAGAALAGAGLPALALALGWRPALSLVAALGLLVVVAAQPARRSLDADRKPARPLTLVGVLAPLRIVLGSRALSELSLAGFIYAATQVCLTSFLVVYLTEVARLCRSSTPGSRSQSPAPAASSGGSAGALSPIVSWHRAACSASSACSPACAPRRRRRSTRDWPPALVLAPCALFGATAIGWNGVQLAELARHAPKGAAGAITGASGFITFVGVVVGPPLFALLATLTGGYRAGFVACGLASGLCGLYFLASKSK